MSTINYTTTERYTDTGNAARLVRTYGDTLRYVPGWGWLVYDGKRWTRDETGHVMELAKQAVKEMYREAADMPDATRGAHIDWAQRSESLFKLKAMIELAQSDRRIAATADAFDTNPWLLNV